ncbi:MAG: hypothetical protein RMI91_12080 [Gemmatales bacterium]|nr:hypothetical protein [Gemmatales bacterium]MDW7995379.1 hypothetical protein [Gemmatales bacterium]
MERPVHLPLLADIEADPMDCVVVCKVARLSHWFTHLPQVMRKFDKHHLLIMSATRQSSTCDRAGYRMSIERSIRPNPDSARRRHGNPIRIMVTCSGTSLQRTAPPP